MTGLSMTTSAAIAASSRWGCPANGIHARSVIAPNINLCMFFHSFLFMESSFCFF
jgi:hypothetical protein